MKLFLREIKEMMQDMGSVSIRSKLKKFYHDPDNILRVSKMLELLSCFKGELQNLVSQMNDVPAYKKVKDLTGIQKNQIAFLRRKINLVKALITAEIGFQKLKNSGACYNGLLIDYVIEKVDNQDENTFNNMMAKKESSEKVVGEITDKDVKKYFSFVTLFTQDCANNKIKDLQYQAWQQGLIEFLKRVLNFEIERRKSSLDNIKELSVRKDWKLVIHKKQVKPLRGRA